MTKFTVCVWNIKNYGSDAGTWSGKGKSNWLRNMFIASFVFRHGIDVLVIQEMMPDKEDALADLVHQITAKFAARSEKEWAYAYCASSIDKSARKKARVTGRDDLAYATGARSEGYAIVWSRAPKRPFTMVDGVVDIAASVSTGVTSPLNMSQFGRPTGTQEYVHWEGKKFWGSVGGFTTGNVYPYLYNKDMGVYQLMTTWPKLGLPATARDDPDRKQFWAGVRRPVYAIARLRNGKLFPIIAYHAPSRETRASWGAYLSGLIRENYVIDALGANGKPLADAPPVQTSVGFFGGDFNHEVKTSEDWPEDYCYFVWSLDNTYLGGANQQAVPLSTLSYNERKTTVRLVVGLDDTEPIVGGKQSQYLGQAIDLGFSPAGSGVSARKIDLMTEVKDNPNKAYSEVLDNTARWMDRLAGSAKGPVMQMTARGPQVKVRDGNGYKWSYLVTGGYGSTFVNWQLARNEYRKGVITNWRRAAEYVHLFVSDHMPLIASIEGG